MALSVTDLTNQTNNIEQLAAQYSEASTALSVAEAALNEAKAKHDAAQQQNVAARAKLVEAINGFVKLVSEAGLLETATPPVTE